ncbi:60S ribosomal protein L7-B, putative [Perkinsus marinus ATCC 50983]|uniref:60S ribosomal protein L7-B, putative n=2 Tax=Perkinsus marinus (strain ATCC 50983 / TXsc) TaxID=423536 RepID=C5KXP5_PERM5|nr:60S ribosomal protein L7-B, putative [Perkinsus marinus ATCC 50983]EER10769.1 60S ribosomal protein L7-B, putative [Perkinsus marinus ATCC 50983]|eukprot:XP_002778974.1 60S ribosomal protein L7-B, putative [Perkinsus marinus ATCC 50983]
MGKSKQPKVAVKKTDNDLYKPVLRPKNEGESIKVAEAVIKRRDRNLKALAARQRRVKEQKLEKKRLGRAAKMISANSLVVKARERFMDRRRAKVTKQKNKRMAVLGDVIPGRVFLVVRNDRRSPSATVLKALRKMGLRKYGHAMFLEDSLENRELLRICETFVYYGVPSPKAISDLLHKKAYIQSKAGEGYELLTNNLVIEEALGDINILSVEDIVDVVKAGNAGESPNLEKLRRVLSLLVSFTMGDVRKADVNVPTSKIVWGYVKRMDNMLYKTL